MRNKNDFSVLKFKSTIVLYICDKCLTIVEEQDRIEPSNINQRKTQK